jgi:hypothetical protein
LRISQPVAFLPGAPKLKASFFASLKKVILK